MAIFIGSVEQGGEFIYTKDSDVWLISNSVHVATLNAGRQDEQNSTHRTMYCTWIKHASYDEEVIFSSKRNFKYLLCVCDKLVDAKLRLTTRAFRRGGGATTKPDATSLRHETLKTDKTNPPRGSVLRYATIDARSWHQKHLEWCLRSLRSSAGVRHPQTTLQSTSRLLCPCKLAQECLIEK